MDLSEYVMNGTLNMQKNDRTESLLYPLVAFLLASRIRLSLKKYMMGNDRKKEVLLPSLG